MSYDFYIKQNDTWPPLKARLLDADNEEIPVVDAQEIKFIMTKEQNRNLVIIDTVNIDVIEENGENWVVYYWNSNDTETSGGYQGEFIVTLADGNVVTVPNKNDEYVMILIGRELG